MILDELEGCHVYPSAYVQLSGVDKKEAGARSKITPDPGTIDVVITQESWTRRARRAKLQTSHSSISISANSPKEVDQPLLMARLALSEAQAEDDTGLIVTVSWTYGMDAIKFESFAMFLIAAVERGITPPDQV